MPIKKSAIKHLRQTKVKTKKNQEIKKKFKQFIKETRRAISAHDKEKVKGFLGKLQKVVDKAAVMKVISDNTAARLKSRLMANIHKLLKQ